MGRLKTKLQELQETLELQENMAYDHCAAKWSLIAYSYTVVIA
jgi:DMSO/TMAO reductase YedYZ molybdopterin-dependent catalytic subunit